jgi:lipopolysaccharide transport system permease protein
MVCLETGREEDLRSSIKLAFSPFGSAWSHRGLLKSFVVKEISGRFEGTFVGVLWAVLQPLATLVAYFFVFSVVLRMRVTFEEHGTDSFAVFFLSGMLPWLFFSDALTRSVGCLVDNGNLITKVVFPVEVLPSSKVLTALLLNGVGIALFLMYMAIKGYFGMAWLLILVVLAVHVLFTLGLACFLSAACVFIRDIRELLGVILMIWFFATPIIYPASMIPASFKSFMAFNPMVIFARLYRELMLRNLVVWEDLLKATVLGLLVCAFGMWFFMRAKPAFGDVL